MERDRSRWPPDSHCVQVAQSLAWGNASSVARWAIIKTAGSAPHCISMVVSAHSIPFVAVSFTSDWQCK